MEGLNCHYSFREMVNFASDRPMTARYGLVLCCKYAIIVHQPVLLTIKIE